MPPKTAKANVTPIRQRTQYTCMSTSMAMALQALGQTNCDEDTVNRVMGAQPMKGASWENALACAQHFGMRATLTSPCTVKQLKAWTDQGVPVLIAWNPEGREWSHASLVFDVDDNGNVSVADPNIPDPEETVRVVSKSEFYSKWFEKWPNYLVRRPAMAIEREITVDGRQVQAGKKEQRSQKDKGMARFLKNGPVNPTEKSDANKAMDKAQWEIRKEQGTAGLPGAGMGAGYHKDKSRYDRKRDKNVDREASLTQPLSTRRDYGATPMLSTENFLRVLKMAEDLPGPVEDYVKEVQDANPDYSEGQAWATAWSIYCKYKNPGSDHCQKSPSEYFKAASQKLSGLSKRAGHSHYWEMKEAPTPVEWASLLAAVKTIIRSAAKAGVVVRGGMGTGAPELKADHISLNGDGKAGLDYETFYMEPVVSKFEFCKTGERPYDAVVVSILAAAKGILGKKIVVRSDGGPSAIRRVFGGDITAKFEKGVSMTVDEVAEVVGPEFKEMNENPPDSVVKVREEMQGKTAAELTSTEMFADLLKDSKFEKGKSVPLSELPEELQDNVSDPPPSVKKLTDELKDKTATLSTEEFSRTLQAKVGVHGLLDFMLNSFVEHYNGDAEGVAYIAKITGNPKFAKELAKEWMKVRPDMAHRHGGLLRAQFVAEDLVARVSKATGFRIAKFEEGKPADPTENMSDEDAAEWERQNDAHKDEFKGAGTEEDQSVVEHFLHKSAAGPQGAAQVAIMGYLDSHEPGTFLLTDMARTMRGMHFKNIMSAANALKDKGLVTFDGVSVSAVKATKTADMMDLWVGWVEDPEGYMTRFLPPSPRGSMKRQLQKIPGSWEMMEARKALRDRMHTVSPSWVSKLPHQDKSDLEAFLDMSPVRVAATGLYGFTKATESACGAGVNKLQKAAKRIASALYAKDEGSPSFLAKHASKGGSKTAALLLKAMESLGPMAQINKTASGNKWKVWTGPVAVKEVAEALKGVHSVSDVMDGTEHVYFKYDGDMYDLAKEGVPRVVLPYLKGRVQKLAGKSGKGLYGFSEKTARLGVTACNDLRHEAGVIAGDLFARKGADPVRLAGYLASHAKKAKCPYAAMLGECGPDTDPMGKTAASPSSLWKWNTTHLKWEKARDVSPDTAVEWLEKFQKDEPAEVFALSSKAPPTKEKGNNSMGVSKAEVRSVADKLNESARKSLKTATDFLASDEEDSETSDSEC